VDELDPVLHVAVQDLDHLHAFLVDRLSKRAEVTGFRTPWSTGTPAMW
jgi:hypothetical protein